RLQEGDASVVDHPERLPHARHRAYVRAAKTGFLSTIHCEQVGVASMMLGGGREKKEDSIDPAVGLVIEKKIGDQVLAGETLCTVHYNLDSRLPHAMNLLEKSFEIGPVQPSPQPLVHKIIGDLALA